MRSFPLGTIRRSGVVLTGSRVRNIRVARYGRRPWATCAPLGGTQPSSAQRRLVRARGDIVREIIDIVRQVASGLPPEQHNPLDDGLPGG
jgi:hypothetical protein